MATFLFTVTDPRGSTISLTDVCYYRHILFEHPDMDSVEEIAKAIEEAEIVAVDSIDTSRFIYYRTVQRRPQHWWIKVVVDAAQVVTAYRVRRIKQGEMILWHS